MQNIIQHRGGGGGFRRHGLRRDSTAGGLKWGLARLGNTERKVVMSLVGQVGGRGWWVGMRSPELELVGITLEPGSSISWDSS